jgi:nucleoside-diphosphate-sugar epimerase
MKILVFGGNKFLGKHLLQSLTTKFPEAEIFCLTRSGVSSQPKIKSLIADRLNTGSLTEALQELSFDFVFDLSAYKLEDLTPSLDLLKERVKTWVYVSSAGVYAKSEVFPLQAHFPKVASLPHVGKLQCEEALKAVSGLHSFCIRPFYIYGPDNTFDRESFLFRAIEAEETILLPGDGSTLLQFAYVEDVAHLLVELARKEKSLTQHKAFHAADKEAYTINAIVETCGEVVGKKAKVKFFSSQDCSSANVQARDIFPLRAEHYFGDVSALESLGLKTQINLKEGLSQTYAWFQSHREQYPQHTITEAGLKINPVN